MVDLFLQLVVAQLSIAVKDDFGDERLFPDEKGDRRSPSALDSVSTCTSSKNPVS